MGNFSLIRAYFKGGLSKKQCTNVLACTNTIMFSSCKQEVKTNTVAIGVVLTIRLIDIFNNLEFDHELKISIL